MAKYTQGKEGKFTGSVGSGKTRVPTVAETPSASGSPAPKTDTAAVVAEVYTAYKSDRAKTGSPAPPAAWSHTDPIWPKRAVAAEIVAGAKPPAGREEDFARAFRSVYKAAWMKKFSRVEDDFRITPIQPADDAEGWMWRREVLEEARRDFAGAHVAGVQTLQRCQTVYGQGIRTVTRVTTYTDEEGKPEAVYVQFLGNHSDRNGPDADYIRLPALDRQGDVQPSGRSTISRAQLRERCRTRND